MAENKIFRKVSLERLSSPEQLDMLTRVTTPTSWMALCMLALIIVMAVVWGFFGSLPIKVRGQGILLNQGGITKVVSLGSGFVTEVVVHVDDYVRSGQVVARIAKPILLNELRNTRNELEEEKHKYQRLVDFSERDMQNQITGLQTQREIIGSSLLSLDKRLTFIRQQLDKQEQLLAKGLIVPSRVEKTRQELVSIEEEVKNQKLKIEDLRAQEFSLKNKTENAIRDSEYRINAVERRIALMENRLTNDSRVVSKVSGKVVEIQVSPGNVVSMGSPVISVESQEKKLEAILYVPSSDGKKVRSGMEMDIVPSSVKKEEHGSALGLVAFVSDYPATYQGMVRVLKNEQLAESLSQNAAPYAVRAELIPDSKTHSGYKWTSGEGPPTTLQPGTICQGEITVEHKRPIDYVIPYLKNRLGL